MNYFSCYLYSLYFRQEHSSFYSMEGDKPFSCEICTKAFKLKGDLNRHTRIHTGVKPYRCDICKKTFTRIGALDDHKIIHTGERPYE